MKFILLLITLFISAQSQYKDELESFLNAKWDSLHTDQSYPGGSLGIALPNGDVIGLTIGYSDLEQKIKLKASDKLLIGSTGKTFFSAVAMRLIESGKLQLDKNVSDYIGDLDWYHQIQNAKDITIRHLMNHTSGIERYVFDQRFDSLIVNEKEMVWTVKDRLSFIFDKAPLFPAGTDFAYSDLNYIF
ncbi:MAG: beta-lactamase family protein [Calditrichaeota bacterium]|nr:beta-lactamase family protein [Calditrichota bacterium]